MSALSAEKQERLNVLLTEHGAAKQRRYFQTGLQDLDALAPSAQFECGAVHELLTEPEYPIPQSVALLLVHAAAGALNGAQIWSDPTRELYPPAVEAMGIDLRRLILLQCNNWASELWALSECLSCRGVGAVFASIRRLTRVEARRLQLAAERGGGVGIFHRPISGAGHDIYAAATRWHIKPVTGDGGVQRWKMQLVHGHGGQVGRSVLLEVDRETGDVCASAPMADRPAAPPSIRITA